MKDYLVQEEWINGKNGESYQRMTHFLPFTQPYYDNEMEKVKYNMY
jgi:hypothetical protein